MGETPLEKILGLSVWSESSSCKSMSGTLRTCVSGELNSPRIVPRGCGRVCPTLSCVWSCGSSSESLVARRLWISLLIVRRRPLNLIGGSSSGMESREPRSSYVPSFGKCFNRDLLDMGGKSE
jgi:hypothetical protein